MSKLIRSKKGASSILVILMLVVLVVFGVAALTTAISNVRLGQKAADWNDKYYSADAKANEMYAQIDKAVSDWRTACLQYSGVQPDLNDFLNELEFDVRIAEVGENSFEFSYETWEDNVGISVVLSYDKKSDFDINQYKAIVK